MAETQLAIARVPAPETPRLALGRELRLAGIPQVLATIRAMLDASPSRIELDASGLRLMTEGARQVLVAATQHLATRSVELVMVGCEPFD